MYVLTIMYHENWVCFKCTWVFWAVLLSRLVHDSFFNSSILHHYFFAYSTVSEQLNGIWQNFRWGSSQRPLPNLCFWSWSKNRDDCPGLNGWDIFNFFVLNIIHDLVREKWNKFSDQIQTFRAVLWFICQPVHVSGYQNVCNLKTWRFFHLKNFILWRQRQR